MLFFFWLYCSYFCCAGSCVWVAIRICVGACRLRVAACNIHDYSSLPVFACGWVCVRACVCACVLYCEACNTGNSVVLSLFWWHCYQLSLLSVVTVISLSPLSVVLLFLLCIMYHFCKSFFLQYPLDVHILSTQFTVLSCHYDF